MMVRSEKMKIDAETERLKAEAVGIKVVADTVAGMDVAGSVRETQKKEVERLTVGVERVVAATVKAPKKVEETKRKNSEKAVKKVGETTRKTSEKERAVVPKLPKR
ncbi:uncharacterized protein LAJ45_10315 [Morchella importuna]|uniref:uncharacterized protein n=1 Tax=Morchella importuna TaxID=1174673 RepID=UPI001E8CC696|nr:uncharacterized protein LAJ45_10315 [Morchella importuna]KAH8145675.1 hypothetical protein LAJ45_10315 [Morchella importuna]